MYVVLAFGLKVLGQILGRVLKPVIAHFRLNGIPVVLYVDDGRVVGRSKAEVIRRFKFVLDTLDRAGWIISAEKCTKPVHYFLRAWCLA